MDEKISNPLETAYTVFSSIGVSPEYDQLRNQVNLYYDCKKVGAATCMTDATTGCTVDVIVVGEKQFRIETMEDINNVKEYIVQKENIRRIEPLEEVATEITVQYLDDTVKRLEVIDKGDWVDLYAAETVKMKAGEFKLIHLGVAMRLPEGYEAHIVPRSSTFKKWGIIQANHMGVIDNSYSGPDDWWRMTALAMRDTVIEKGDKICQFRIVEKQPRLKFTEGKMQGENRGGFGSTGAK